MITKRQTHLIALLLSLVVIAVGQAFGGQVDVPVQAGGAFSVPTESIKNRPFHTTLRQQYDFSCGSAAIATLLTYHYDFPVSEQDVFGEMFSHGNQAKIRREGFSLLDMKNYLQAHGFEADGFQADVEELQVSGLPAVVLIRDNGYNHFVVVKGFKGGRVLVGDPASGTRALTYARFKELWVNHILFVIHNKRKLAKFNVETDWRAAPRASLGDAVYRGGAEPMLPKRGPSDY
jgi:predicted double-glycine peptidase